MLARSSTGTLNKWGVPAQLPSCSVLGWMQLCHGTPRSAGWSRSGRRSPRIYLMNTIAIGRGEGPRCSRSARDGRELPPLPGCSPSPGSWSPWRCALSRPAYSPKCGTLTYALTQSSVLQDGTALRRPARTAPRARWPAKWSSTPAWSATPRRSPIRPTAARSWCSPIRWSATTACRPAFESRKIQAAALIVSELALEYSHARALKSLPQWLHERGHSVPRGRGHARAHQAPAQQGCMLGKIVVDGERHRTSMTRTSDNLVAAVSSPEEQSSTGQGQDRRGGRLRRQGQHHQRAARARSHA